MDKADKFKTVCLALRYFAKYTDRKRLKNDTSLKIKKNTLR